MFIAHAHELRVDTLIAFSRHVVRIIKCSEVFFVASSGFVVVFASAAAAAIVAVVVVGIRRLRTRFGYRSLRSL